MGDGAQYFAIVEYVDIGAFDDIFCFGSNVCSNISFLVNEE
jgi:hypothetical protein